MSLFLTKNLLTTSFLLGFLFSLAANAAKYSYELDFDARYGVHTLGEPNVATNRQTFQYEQKSDFNNLWSSVLGLRVEVEGAYSSLPERYGTGDVGKYESQTFLPRDNYLQYKNGALRVRAGYQQVVWGEAFGLYYADIVNPKDYRNAGLGDLSRNRLDIPMVNAQWIYSESSLQLLFIPWPAFDLLPSSGSDFNSLQLPPAALALPVKIERNPTDPPTRGEYGFRWSKQLNGFDFSFFYLNYFDRLPVYRITTLTSPLSFDLIPEYKPLQSAGTTLTVDLNGYLVRSEIVQHFDREYNTIDGSSNLSSAKSNELVYVVGLDLPPRDRWQVGFQYSESRLKNANWLLRKNTQSLVAARVAKQFQSDVLVETLVSYYTSDSSELLQASVTLPISNQTEFLIGADRFEGNTTSELGRFKNASRAWVMLKTTLKK